MTHNRRRPTRKGTYPLLKQIADVATDDWWRARLQDYSEGSLPRGVVLNGMVISYVHGGTEAHYELSCDLPSAYRELCAFFGHHAKVAPAQTPEMAMETAKAEAIKMEATRIASEACNGSRRTGTRKQSSSRARKAPNGWASSKSRNKRHALLGLFVQMVANEYHLDHTQRMQLKQALFSADLDGALAENVVMDGGYVVSVTCIEYDGESFKYIRNPNRVKPPIRIAPPSNPIYASYPAKQLDPDTVIETHLVNLRKKRSSTVVKKASTLA